MKLNIDASKTVVSMYANFIEGKGASKIEELLQEDVIKLQPLVVVPKDKGNDYALMCESRIRQLFETNVFCQRLRTLRTHLWVQCSFQSLKFDLHCTRLR